MPNKEINTPYPLIDADPHFGRVVRYMRPSDLGLWAAMTAAVPGVLHAWDKAEGTKVTTRTAARLGGFVGFIGGFMMAYQRSSVRFWGWTENEREEKKDLAELSARAAQGLPLYGSSDQPAWVQHAAYRNSAFSQLKFASFPWFNLVDHPHHGTDPAKYGVKQETTDS